MKKFLVIILITMAIQVQFTPFVFAHCDTMDGPVITDAKKAIQQKNVNFVLKWVRPESEKELKRTFSLISKVRILSPEAKEVSDKYFFDTLVRLHRSGEGLGFTGVKPSGTPINEKIKAADKSILIGNLSPLKGLVKEENIPELKKRFNKVLSLKKFEPNNIDAGREYVEAYVQFFHYAEGEEESHGGHINSPK